MRMSISELEELDSVYYTARGGGRDKFVRTKMGVTKSA